MELLWTRFKRDKAALIGLVVIVACLLVAIVGPYVSQGDPADQTLRLRRAVPSAEHPLGMDHLGRDIMTRMIFGARYTILAGMAATLVGALGGLALGLLSGYYGRWLDEVLMRLVDLLLAFPFFLLAILIIAILGPGLGNAIVAVGIAKIPNYSRVVRSTVLQVREMDYTTAAWALGCSDGRIMLRHILPNVMTPMLVLSTVEMAATILSISGLSFLGLGAQPPLSEWGVLLSEARGYISQAPHIMLFPGLGLALLVLSINLVGDGLQYATDPKLRGR